MGFENRLEKRGEGEGRGGMFVGIYVGAGK